MVRSKISVIGPRGCHGRTALLDPSVEGDAAPAKSRVASGRPADTAWLMPMQDDRVLAKRSARNPLTPGEVVSVPAENANPALTSLVASNPSTEPYVPVSHSRIRYSTRGEPLAWGTSRGACGPCGVKKAHLASSWVQTWLGSRPFTKESTLTKYKSHVDRYLNPNLGNKALGSITMTDVNCSVQQMSNTGVSLGTSPRVLATLSSLRSSAIRAGEIVANPVKGVHLPMTHFRPHTI